MSHNHNHAYETRNIRVAFFLNLGFTIIEIIGGIFTNSMAILSDALHDLGDSLSLGFAWYFQKLASKERDRAFSFGYKRFSVLGAVINSIVLVAGSFIILSEAIPRLVNPEQPDASGMLYLAILGIIVNGAAMLKLKKGKTLNERTVSLHLLEDVLGWVAVLVGSIVMIFFDFPIIDPLISILIAIYILYNIYKNLRSSFKILLQGVPESIDIELVRKRAMKVNNVVDVHDVHAWSMDGIYNILTMHLVMPDSLPLEDVKKTKDEVRQILEDMEAHHVTIECENESDYCRLEDC